jgi:hypothetical protein
VTVRKVLPAAALTLLVCAGVGGIASAGNSDRGVSDYDREGRRVAAIPPNQAQQFGELRRAPRSDDALPASMKQTLAADPTVESRWGANIGLARRAGVKTWLIPGDGVVCAVVGSHIDGTFGLTCAAPDEISRGYLQHTEVDDGGNGVLTGVLPDGVDSVDIVLKDGSSETVKVQHNTYQTAIDDQVKTVEFVDPAGVKRSLPLEWVPPTADPVGQP